MLAEREVDIRHFMSGFDEGETVEFRLTYDGPLPSTSNDILAVKHGIREQIHPQLVDLSGRSVPIRLVVRQVLGLDKRVDNFVYTAPDLAAIGAKYKLRDIQFVPLIINEMHLACSLDILFLRREKPGSLITKPKDEYGGDLDNRLKVFLDALRTPREDSEIPKGATWPADVPFFCLLEDDSLVTKFQVEADTLLGEGEPDKQKDVRLVVRVTTRVTRSTVYNIDFLA